MCHTQRLNDYIESSLVHLRAEADKLPPIRKQAWEGLNERFLRVVETRE